MAPREFYFKVIKSRISISMDELDLVRWLRLYGEVLSAINEVVHPESDNYNPTGSGIYTVKMRLKEHIPQFIPAYGRKLKIMSTSLGLTSAATNVTAITTVKGAGTANFMD